MSTWLSLDRDEGFYCIVYKWVFNKGLLMRYGSKALEIPASAWIACLGEEGLNVDAHRNVDLTPETVGTPGLEHRKSQKGVTKTEILLIDTNTSLHLESGDASPRPPIA